MRDVGIEDVVGQGTDDINFVSGQSLSQGTVRGQTRQFSTAEIAESHNCCGNGYFDFTLTQTGRVNVNEGEQKLENKKEIR